jgi:DNA-binding CsgD family transcriptional regulator
MGRAAGRMTHLVFFYYLIAYSIGLPAFAIIAVGYAKTGNKVLGGYLPLLFSVSLQLLLMAILRYEDAAMPSSASTIGFTTRHAYFLAESTLTLSLPLFCHRIADARRRRLLNLVFCGVFAACVALILSPVFLSASADGPRIAALPGFYAYRILYFIVILYGIARIAFRFRGLASKELKAIASFCIVSVALSLWEILHCELFPVLGHSIPGVALSPVAYFATNAFFIVYVIRAFLLAKPPKASPAEEAFSKYGISAREREIALLLASGCSNREIGTRLFISDSTVKTHVKSLYRKIGVRNRVQMVNALKGSA